MPDLIQPIIGYRRWLMEDGLLRSAGAGQALWNPGVTVAECDEGRDKLYQMAEPGEPHDAPAPDCGCGLYANHEPPKPTVINELDVYVHGAIAAWGRIEVHADGFRAEKARVTALHVPPGAALTLQMEITDVAERYGARPVGSLEELGPEAREHGIACPGEHIPVLSDHERHMHHHRIVAHMYQVRAVQRQKRFQPVGPYPQTRHRWPDPTYRSQADLHRTLTGRTVTGQRKAERKGPSPWTVVLVAATSFLVTEQLVRLFGG